MWCSTISTVLPSRVDRADQLDELRHVLHRHAGHRLVEQDHAGVAGQHHRQLELALVAVREQAGGQRRPSLETDAAERPVRPLDSGSHAVRLPPDPHRPAERRLRREPDVLERRQQREHVRDLERAADPGAGAPERRLGRDVDAVEKDAAARRPGQAGDEVEERRLAGPVRADDGKQLTFADLEPDTGDDGCAADVEPEIPGCEDRGCAHARMVVSLSPSSARSAAPSGTASRCRGPPGRGDRSSRRASHGTSAAASRDPAA